MFSLCTKALAIREHSCFQIKNKLSNKGFDKDVIENVLQELKDNGFQSDVRYLSEYIRYRQNQGHSSKKIIYELKSNGISSELINQKVNEFVDDYEILLDLANYKIKTQDLRDEKTLRKYVNYFKSRGLYPNVDFYSGIIYRALGIPTDMFTVMFALGRLPGWIAQWKEMRENKEPIGRPRQVYTGANEREYVPINNR